MMLITNTNRALIRPKYWPRKLYKSWTVRDTKTRKIIYGPDSWYACNNFIKNNKGTHS